MSTKLGFTSVSLLFVLATLAACGGGGGGDGGGSTAAPPPNNSATAPPPDNVAGWVYVANHVSFDVSAYAINDTTGALVEVAGSPFAAGGGPRSIAAHPSGKFAYVANAGAPNNAGGYTDGGISAYSINNAGDAFNHQIAIDASGNALAVWYQWDGALSNIWANRFQ